MKYTDFFNEYDAGNFSAPQPDFDKYDAVSNPTADPNKTLTGRFTDPSVGLNEKAPCWKGYKQIGMKDKNGKQVPNCVPIDEVEELHDGEYCTQCLKEYILEHANVLTEAEYQGRKVSLGKPFRTSGGPKKFSVYVKNKKGNTIKVNFGDPNMRIKKSIPGRRKSFRARHKCATAKDRTSARYWSCRTW